MLGEKITKKSLNRLLVLFISTFRMHERHAATGQEFGIILQMSLEHALAQRFKQSAKWTEKVTDTKNAHRNAYISLATKPANSS